jgi:hypothetical protein
MVFVPVMWPGYEMACLTQSGRAALGVTHEKQVRLLARVPGAREWKVLGEWPVERLSHTDIMTHLGNHPEPGTPEGLLALIAPLETPR